LPPGKYIELRSNISIKPSLSSYPPIEAVGAAIGRPPNYLLANNLISAGNIRIIAFGNPDLFHKSGGRPMAAPTVSQGHFLEQQLDKLEFCAFIIYHS